MNPRAPGWLALAVLIAAVSIAPAAQPARPDTADTGFRAIFDGKTLAGWDGDPRYWRVEDGCLVGEVTSATLLNQNSFIIWRGGLTADFELKLEYRISARGNSGINYRSTEIPGQPFALRGYQADLDGPERNAPPLRHSGQNYEERGRAFLARRGDVVRVDPSGKPFVVGSLGHTEALAGRLKGDDWNEVHLIARGATLIHIFNGVVMSVVVDDDAERRRTEGLLGVQVHVGPPMKVEFRALRLKAL